MSMTTAKTEITITDDDGNVLDKITVHGCLSGDVFRTAIGSANYCECDGCNEFFHIDALQEQPRARLFCAACVSNLTNAKKGN